MKGIITTVAIIGVAGLGVYLYKKAHTVTEVRDVTEDENWNEMFDTCFGKEEDVK